MVSFFDGTYPNRTGITAIDNPNRSEEFFDQYDLRKAPEKFTDDFSVVCRQEMFILVF